MRFLRSCKFTAVIPLLFLLFCVSSAYGEWLQDGKPVYDKPFAKTSGKFGAILIFTDKPDELFEAWLQDTEGVDFSMVEEIKENNPITALIIFSNSAPDNRGMSNVTVKFTVLSPDGDVINKTGELEVWVNRPTPPERILELSVDYMKLDIKEKNQPGFHTVKAVVHDKNSDTRINLERQFRVIEDTSNPKYVLLKIISRPKAKGSEIVPEGDWEPAHMAIVTDILPHGIWEMGPDSDRKIVTTNTVDSFSEWHPHLVTQKCIELGGDYIHSQFVEVDRNGLFKAIKLYEGSWVGQKYNSQREGENYAVETVIYGAGGDINNATLVTR